MCRGTVEFTGVLYIVYVHPIAYRAGGAAAAGGAQEMGGTSTIPERRDVTRPSPPQPAQHQQAHTHKQAASLVKMNEE